MGKRKTVILSTHILQEVEAICSQVLIINDGRIAAQGKPEEIAGSMKGGDTWELILKGAGGDEINSKLPSLGQVVNPAVDMTDNGNVSVNFFLPSGGLEDSNSGERIFDWAVNQKLKILEMKRKKISIEDIFVKLTSEQNKPSVNQQGAQ